ncbi:hypothetical protein OQA88_2408 [Cercophora sp. LCS_1]
MHHNDLAADLGLSSAPHFERAPEHESVHGAGRGRNPAEYLGNMDARTTVDSAVDLSMSSTFEDLLDCDLSLLENWNPAASNHSSHSQWPPLHPQPGPTPSSDEFDAAAAAMTRQAGRSITTAGDHPRVSGVGIQIKPQQTDACRVPKPEGSQRAHYAVEKRYRSALNEKYAALARLLSSDAVQRACKSKSPGWSFEAEGTSNESGNGNGNEQQGVKNRQRKTTTLSVVIDTIRILETCCREDARELEQLRSGVSAIRDSAAELLGTGSVAVPSPSRALPTGAGSSNASASGTV